MAHNEGRTSPSKQCKKNQERSGSRETGGHYYPDQEYDSKDDKKANRAYERYSREDDSERIAKISGFSVDDIQTIRTHVFFKKHKLDGGIYGCFAPDYNMVVAWKRLREGKPLDRDITLLHHELLESQIEKQYNLNTHDAHDEASKIYDWLEQLHRETGKKGEKRGIL